MEDVARARAEAVDELLALIVDELVPAVGWYRNQLARKLGTGLPGLAVLEDARRQPTTASRTALRCGMTPSAAAKVIRRLEVQGHVERTPSGEHEQELLVELTPHERRDLIAELIRVRLRGTVQHVVSTLDHHQEPRRRVAAETLIQVAWALGREAWEMQREASDEAHASRRRRERERSGRRPTWQR